MGLSLVNRNGRSNWRYALIGIRTQWVGQEQELLLQPKLNKDMAASKFYDTEVGCKLGCFTICGDFCGAIVLYACASLKGSRNVLPV